jgi:hypothetical protein
MSLNSKLIDPQLDGEEYENSCPTLGTLMVAHFSTPDPAQHNPVIYGADGLFFATHMDRRMYLRPAFRNEFDVFTTESDFQLRPVLWVLVSQLWPGFHEITPRWRGKSFWRDLESDGAVATALMKMSLRNGVHLSEWIGFITDQRIRKAESAKNRSVN